MLKATMKYGAIRAKVQAMSARLLTREDMSKLCACRSVSEVTALLRTQSGWGAVFSAVPAASTVAVYNSAVRKRVFEDYEKLYKFSAIEDKRMLLFMLHRFEYEYLLSELRRMISGEMSILLPEPSGFFLSHTKLDLSAVRLSATYGEFLTAIEGSVFHDVLAALPLEENTGLPKYSSAALACEHKYYAESFSYMKHKTSPTGRRTLCEMAGAEADAVNIVSILRLQRSFPSSLVSADALLIPIRYRLKPENVSQLLSLNSETEAVEYLRTTPCARYLKTYSPERLEGMAEDAMSDFCKKLLHAAEPDVYIPQAYLIALDLEARKLSRLLEAADYGIDPSVLI